MYWSVPTSCPTSVWSVVTARSESVARATPKSMIFGSPAESTRMFAGLQIAVDDPLLVAVVDRVADLREELSRSRSPSRFLAAYSVRVSAFATYSIAKYGDAALPSSCVPAS